MRFLSLFSGVEAASVAWIPLGWECVAVAEIEPFPCAVLKHHYPGVPNLGDITKITEADIRLLGHIDIVIMGFPCQDASTAGKGTGLFNEDGSLTRTGLFFPALRIVAWSRARWLVGENVPGLFSCSGGRDFAAVVGALVGAKIGVPKDGWRNAGVALGPAGLCEWATLDAQYVRVESHPRAVPQRRRRVLFVRDSGDWSRRPPVLFEPQSLRRHTPPRRGAREDVTGTIGGSFANRGYDDRGDTGGVLPIVAGGLIPEVAGTIQNSGKAAGSATQQDAEAGMLVADTVRSHPRPGSNSAGNLAIIQDVAHSLRADGFDASEDGTGRGTPIIPVEAFGGNNTAGSIDVATAVRAHPSPHLDFESETFIAFRSEMGGNDGGVHSDGSAPTCTSAPPAVAFSCKDHGQDAGEVSPTLRSMHESEGNANGGGQVAVAFQTRIARNGRGQPEEVCPALNGADAGETSDSRPCVIHKTAVRRLTPLECERLQGFPDGYTAIPVGKRSQVAKDGPRYKAIGNSMATNVIQLIGRRILAAHSL